MGSGKKDGQQFSAGHDQLSHKLQNVRKQAPV